MYQQKFCMILGLKSYELVAVFVSVPNVVGK